MAECVGTKMPRAEADDISNVKMESVGVNKLVSVLASFSSPNNIQAKCVLAGG